jgi:hypothetical protein
VASGSVAAYRARCPRATPLHRLFDAFFDEVRGRWEERFERRCGCWRGFVDERVLRYLDCGLFENGFARIRCPECAEEYLLAFSCKTRELCPSCAAKRSAATAALLAEEVLAEVAHAQWVLVIPKMLRPHFLHHRELLGGLARAAWERVLELMRAAVGALHHAAAELTRGWGSQSGSGLCATRSRETCGQNGRFGSRAVLWGGVRASRFLCSSESPLGKPKSSKATRRGVEVRGIMAHHRSLTLFGDRGPF